MTASSSPDCGLIIFLRSPELGKVKTRIAETLGDEEALRIYKQLSDQTLQMAAGLAISVYLFYEGGIPGENDRLPSFHYLPQTKGDLGEKITQALEFTFQRHQSAIIVGSDCPFLSGSDIFQTISLLETNEVVIGPASDGGYFLMGCSKFLPYLFTSIDWGTPAVFLQTLQKIKEQGHSYSLLRTLDDIDTAEDWHHYLTRT